MRGQLSSSFGDTSQMCSCVFKPYQSTTHYSNTPHATF